MPCLSLRLPTAKKAWWKSLTSKIQSKLHRLNKPKSITKHRSSSSSSSLSKRISKTTTISKRFFVETKRLNHQRKRRRLVLLPLKRSRGSSAGSSSSITAPVYVDKLFKDTPVSEKVEHLLQYSIKHVHAKVGHDQYSPATVAAGTSKEAARNGGGKVVVAANDDVWESMGFASPQMHGIDERAEQFIAKFRAEMEVQERLARDHL
ncbi:uncharacterized protein LOC133785163 [Humulus lupulus]|uniref:uncharacterized protein LOC133785163 n=1 Tax=Humulus lupulus TaxID=3486 RepID=UPI002B40B7D3|nr:uncharacterized protein LOC133785163 [Humulus lupulus]